jgi:hypothetical protein
MQVIDPRAERGEELEKLGADLRVDPASARAVRSRNCCGS